MRSKNEDRLLTLSSHRLFAVADGMGGHKNGDIAADSAIKTLQKSIQTAYQNAAHHDLPALTQILTQAYSLANSKILEKASDMGTTLCSLLFDGRFAIHAHVGDSRLYRLRENKLEQLTVDHSAMRERLTKKQDTENTKHILTKALGGDLSITTTIAYQVAFPKDRYLLCTDGLTDVLKSEEIKILMDDRPLQTACDELIKLARERGSLDDISTVLIQVEFPDPI